MPIATPWAILLTKWNDKSDEPKPQSFFQKLFTTAGTGTFNMTDYFDTMSHGSNRPLCEQGVWLVHSG